MHWHGRCRWAEKGGGLAGMGWAGWLAGQLDRWAGWAEKGGPVLSSSCSSMSIVSISKVVGSSAPKNSKL